MKSVLNYEPCVPSCPMCLTSITCLRAFASYLCFFASYAEENTWHFERLEHYLEQEIQGMLKSFTIRRNNKIFTWIYLVKSDSPILLEVALACLVYFWFILPRSCLFQLVAIGYGLNNFLYKKVKARKARENLKTLKKVRVSKACKKIRHVKHWKRWGHVMHVKKWSHLKNEGT